MLVRFGSLWFVEQGLGARGMGLRDIAGDVAYSVMCTVKGLVANVVAVAMVIAIIVAMRIVVVDSVVAAMAHYAVPVDVRIVISRLKTGSMI